MVKHANSLGWPLAKSLQMDLLHFFIVYVTIIANNKLQQSYMTYGKHH